MKEKKIFNYGSELFADPYYKPDAYFSIDDYKLFLRSVYNNKIEINTSDEKKYFKEIYDYFKDPKNLISKDTLENLKLLKQKFPKILDPVYDELYDSFIDNIIYYRGGSLKTNQLTKIIFQVSKPYENVNLNKAILKSQKYIYEKTGKKHYLSFSRNFDTALEFALIPFENKNNFKKLIDSNRIPVIIGISGNDENLILNPDFSDSVSPFYEDEALYLSNKIKAKEIYIINGNEYLKIYDKFDLNNINIDNRNKLRYNLNI